MARWEPFREIEAVFREFDRALGFGLRSELLWRRATFPGGVARSMPLVDVDKERDRKGMKNITEFIPASYLKALVRLWRSLTNAFSRWFPRWRRDKDWEKEEGTSLPLAFFSGYPLRIDVQDRDDHLIVLAKLPGFGRNDFNVELSGDRLVIRGEKRCLSDGTGRDYHYSERSYGAIARAITLPCEIKLDEAKAKFKNGLLRITLPKSERAKVKRVKIRVQ